MASTPGTFLTDVDTLDDLPGLQQVEQLRRTDKAVTIAGRRHGQDVVAKQLTSSKRHWSKRFAHEVGVYRTFATTPLLWRAPRLHHAGRRRSSSGYPARPRTPTGTRPGYQNPS